MSDLLLHSHSTSHCTTESTISEYVTVLYAAYVLPKMTEEGVDLDSKKWVLLWDCYSVHRSGPLLEVLKSKYPNLILLFVPASCTAELQPLDLSYNFVFKSGVASLFASWLSQVAQEQLLRGVSQDQLRFDLSLKSVKAPWVYMTLKKYQKPRSLPWLMAGYLGLPHMKVLKKEIPFTRKPEPWRDERNCLW